MTQAIQGIPLNQQGALQTFDPGNVNFTNEPLYHFQPYAAAGQNQLTFFQTPVGQATNGYGDTNMELAGQISAGNRFQAQQLEVFFTPGQSVGLIGQAENGKLNYADDVLAAFSTGWVEIYTLNKLYLRVPMQLCPQSTGLTIAGALSDTTTAGASQRTSVLYASLGGSPFALADFMLWNNMQFKVTLNWPSAVALPSGVNGRIGCVFRGIKYLLSQ